MASPGEEIAMAEQILVVEAEELRRHVDFQGFLPFGEEELRRLYDSVRVLPMERDRTEYDPTYKQLVAYTVVAHAGRFLSYLRGKRQGEERLRGDRSIGFGGHINSGDQATLFLDDHLKAAALRELDEEIVISVPHNLSIAGLLNDDSNDVGRVHLGLVYRADLPQPAVSKHEQSITQLLFTKPDNLRRDREQFETWSQILIDNLHCL